MTMHGNESTSERRAPAPGRRRALFGGAALAGALLLFIVGLGYAKGDGLLRFAADDGTGETATLPLPTTREDFRLPGTQPNSITPIFNPLTCKSCHTAPIYETWRGSMMGQAGRDPLFWAAFAVAGDDASDAGEFCLRCHAPTGWFAGRSDPADGSALTPTDIDAGVACEVCHRMVDPVPGATDQAATIDAQIRADLETPPPTNHVASAMIILDPNNGTEGRRRGPFARPLNPHLVLQTDFLGQGQNAVTESRHCGSCHNVDNPLLSWTASPPGGGPAQYWPNETGEPAPSFANGALFPLERTYDEWLNSQYARGGVFAPQFAGAMPSDVVESCQDCHMVRQTGYAALENFGNPTFRDCSTTGCLPAHVFVGGNAWVPKILQDERWRLRDESDAAALNVTAAEAVSMLQRAATLEIEVEPAGSQKVATVRVINETGHKLPTGYPEGRRMWLHLKAYNAAGQVIYESGAYNFTTGHLTEDAAIKVYEAEQGITPQLAAAVGLPAGPTFHFALNNTTYKDNRIPPRGYTVAAFDKPGLRPVGATYADGQYWDDTTYTVPAATVRVVAKLYYQTASKEYIDFLRELSDDGATLGLLWDDLKSPPVIVGQVSFPPNVSFIPVSRKP